MFIGVCNFLLLSTCCSFLKVESFFTFGVNFMNYFFVTFISTIERKTPSQHIIKTDSCWPNIDLKAISILHIKLRSQIICNTHNLKISFFSFDYLSQSEIGKIKLFFFKGNHLKSKISVNKFVLMKFLD